MIENLITNQNNYKVGRDGVSVSEIVIHTNGGPASQGLHNWFQNNTIQVSAHWQVYLNGEIEQYVKNEDTAYHAGVWEENLKSIGIEHEDNGNSSDPVRTNEQYEASAQLIANLYKQNNIPFNDMGRIKPHHEFVPSRPCPDGLSIDRIRSRVNEILNPPHSVPIPEPAKVDSFYRVSKDNVQIGAYNIESDAFDSYINNQGNNVTYQNNDLTVNFKNMSNTLQDQITFLTSQNQLLAQKNTELTAQVAQLLDSKTKEELTINTDEAKIKELETEISNLNNSSVGEDIKNILVKVVSLLKK